MAFPLDTRFSRHDSAAIARLWLRVAAPEAEILLSEAMDAVRRMASTDALVIEDEPIIAMQLESLMQDRGHRVIGFAASQDEAVRIAANALPGLILADVDLGRGRRGPGAVARIVAKGRVPVIFVTAFPELPPDARTADAVFVIPRPFHPDTVAAASFQAVSGGMECW